MAASLTRRRLWAWALSQACSPVSWALGAPGRPAPGPRARLALASQMQLLQGGPGHVQPHFLPQPPPGPEHSWLVSSVIAGIHQKVPCAGRGGGFPSSQTVLHRSCQASQMLRRGSVKHHVDAAKIWTVINVLFCHFTSNSSGGRSAALAGKGGRSLHASRISARGPGENRGAWVTALL